MRFLRPEQRRPYRLLTKGFAGPALVLFLLLTVAFSFSAGLRASRGAAITGDEPFYLATTQSLLHDGDLDLRNQYATHSYRSFFDHPQGLWTQAGPLPDGRMVSPHEPGLAVLLLPGFAAGGLRGAQLELALIAAATFALAFVLAAKQTGQRGLAWLVTGAVALAAPGFIYSTEIYPEIPGAFCIVVALLVLRAAPGAGRGVWMLLLLSALAWLSLKYVPLALVIAAFACWSSTGRERVVLVAAGALSGALYVWFHLAVFGALTPYSTNLVYDGNSTATVLESHFAFEDRSYRIWGLFIDRRFGIGRWAPIFLAVLPALPLTWRWARQGSLVVTLICAQIAMATYVAVTMMGWWFPGRMLIVVYPLFATVLTIVAARLPAPGRWTGAGLALYSLAVTGALVHAARGGEVTIAVDPFALDSPLFRAPAQLFPQYTYWGTDTLVLNAAWLSAGIAALVLAAWSAFGPDLRARYLGGRQIRWRAPGVQTSAAGRGSDER